MLYFATAASFTSLSSEYFAAPSTPTQLLDQLEAKYPGIRHAVLDSAMITVNEEYVTDPDLSIEEGDECAIIPPVSSG